MAVTNSKLVPYKEKVEVIIESLLDSKLTEAQALARLPKGKAMLEKIIDALLKSKEKVTDIIVIAEIDEIVSIAEQGLAKFGAKYLSPNFSEEAPEPIDFDDPVVEDKPSTSSFKQALTEVFNSKVNSGAVAVMEEDSLSNLTPNSVESLMPDEEYYILHPTGCVSTFKDDNALKEYLAEFENPSTLHIIKGKRVKIKVGITIE